MLERIQSYEYYHPKILAQLGCAFINANPNEPILYDENCLQHIGALLISRLKKEPFIIPDNILHIIAFYKQWDTTERVGRKIIPADKMNASDFLERINLRINTLLEQDSSLPKTMCSLLYDTLILTPGNPIDLESIQTKMEESHFQEALKLLIDNLFILDKSLKETEINKQLTDIHNPERLCTWHMFKALNAINALNYSGISSVKAEREDQLDNVKLHQSNIELTQSFIIFMFKSLRRQRLTDSPLQYDKIVYSIAVTADQYMMQYILENWLQQTDSKITQLNQFTKDINNSINNINSDISLLNTMIIPLRHLLSQLDSDDLKNVSTTLKTMISNTCDKIETIKTKLQNHKETLTEVKSDMESLGKAISLGQTDLYKAFQKDYLAFNKRFANPPQQMRQIILQLIKDYDHIQLSCHRIKEQFTNTNGSNLSEGNYLDHHTAYQLLQEVRINIQNLEDKRVKYEIARNKCFAFEETFDDIKNKLCDAEESDSFGPMTGTLNHVLNTYYFLWQQNLADLKSTSIHLKVDRLKEDLDALEAELRKLISKRESEMQINAVTPPAHNRMSKKRDSSHVGTPSRIDTRLALAKRGKILFSFFNNVENAQQQHKPVVTSDKNIDVLKPSNVIKI